MTEAYALRFAHAGQVRIDAPLEGVGRLPDAARRIAADAPISAWDRTVELCIDREVEFLLLTPYTVASALCAWDRAALLSGFQRLSEFDIPVFWALAPGETACDSLPDNVTLLTETDRSATLVCNGRVAAAIRLGDANCPVRSDSSPDASVRIRIEHTPADEHTAARSEPTTPAGTFEYVACWGGRQESTSWVGMELWSDPGTTLHRTAAESGSGGISIVEWTPGSLPEVLRAPTAVVHRQQCRLTLEPQTTCAELTERLQLALLEREPAIGEKLWLIDWQITGAGAEFERLQSAAARDELEAAIDQSLGGGERLLRVHRWELRRRGGNPDDGITQRLLDWLAAHAAVESPTIAADLKARVGQSGCREFGGLGDLDLRAEAAQLLTEWLTGSPASADGGDRTSGLEDGEMGDGA